MDPVAWLQKAYDELVELGGSTAPDPSDAWRAVALIARLVGSPNGPVPPADVLQRLPEFLATAERPDVQGLLDRVDEGLDVDEDAGGPLLDGLLDVDDAVGLLQLNGNETVALELARRVAGLVALCPERVLALGSFAEMRLATLRDDAVVGAVWRAVEAAPAYVLAEALPAVGEATDLIEPLAARLTWLEDAWHQVQGSTGDVVHAVATGVTASQGPAGGTHVDFAANLGKPREPSVELVWGEVRRFDIPLKTTVKLRVPPACQLWYRTSAGSAPLTESAWQLEAGESPVLITVTESTSAKSADAAVANGARAAGVLLVQVDDEGSSAS